MHPRNVYKTPPDFAKLAVKYPEFLKVSNIDLNGTVRIDFKDANALRVLTKCLLSQDFELDVEIPDNRLVPTVTLRLNYLLWVEDLLTGAGITENIFGVDIGTGACCIYPLIAAKKFKWRMYATEIDEESLKHATANIERNNLTGSITLKKVSADGNLLMDRFAQYGGELDSADFCMCNPPFFSSVDDMDLSRSPYRTPPRNARTGSANEIITPGGEDIFVKRLIRDSLILRDKVKIYTTMLGHKNLLSPMLDILHAYGVKQYTYTIFKQGKTMRWGIAWSFIDSSKLCDLPVPQKQKMNKPMSFTVPALNGIEHTVKNVSGRVVDILKGIDVRIKVVQRNEINCTMEIKAERNTWSNQRRKRREMMNKDRSDPSLDSTDVHDDSEGETPAKRIKLDQNTASEYNNNTGATTTSAACLNAAMQVYKADDCLYLQIGYLNGSSGRDGVHQIVQYIKNNWR